MKHQISIPEIQQRTAGLTESVSRAAIRILEYLPSALGAVVLLLACVPAFADAETTVDEAPDVAAETRPLSPVENLASIQQSIELKRSAILVLRKQLKKTDDATEKKELEQKITHIRSEISNLQLSFEHVALGGIDPATLNEQPDEKIDWQGELEQISKPLLSSLKQLTAKPRQIDSLQRDIGRYEDQLKVIDSALHSIRSFSSQVLPAVASKPVNQLLTDWQQRRDDVQRALEIARSKLDNLSTDGAAWHTGAGEAITDFIKGRGLTLLLAVITGVAVWLASRGLLWLYWRLADYRSSQDTAVRRAPLAFYSFRLATGAIIVLATLMVFYIRGDILLLTLAVIALAGIALSLRQTLPRYAAEVRLLLGIGPVRERERLVLDGVPFKVESLGIYSVLRNPALEGIVRLPLHAMNSFTSRPASNDLWFPCRPGDYVLLASGSFARILRQTIELVEVAIRDSIAQIRTSDFISQGVRNLTREGFGIACTFGIDYQHQAICLDTVPGLFREAILARFEQADMKDDIKDLIVEFKTAGASSLDYQIYLTLKGRAANAYFRAERMIQQACVETCNREGWVIPFTQITVHSGDAEAKTDRVASDKPV